MHEQIFTKHLYCTSHPINCNSFVQFQLNYWINTRSHHLTAIIKQLLSVTLSFRTLIYGLNRLALDFIISPRQSQMLHIKKNPPLRGCRWGVNFVDERSDEKCSSTTFFSPWLRQDDKMSFTQSVFIHEPLALFFANKSAEYEITWVFSLHIRIQHRYSRPIFQ